ncbi:hypothetical protein H632_c60p2 [Helicosporidium sp. ATCC 50920]|nr:hypothetical protein H632_c60p2 [Helicosporidium sp. ATCC 50920]|eukprot:KDD76940.1 hypothetical protein H632_c60p2 [Helicosporidium sp. ATCC 50920]
MDGGGGGGMEASFKEFLARPENRKLVEKQQRKEVRQSVALQERAELLRFKDTLLASDFEAQAAVAPFLNTPVLRRIVQTFANDSRGDFARWARNPRVIEMLSQAQAAIREGRVSEAEMEHLLLAQLRDPEHEAHAQFSEAARPRARLPTEALVGALNEHLQERRAGNALFRQRLWGEAIEKYTRAASIVELIEALSSADQDEVDSNRAAVWLNLAAAHLHRGEPGEAERFCSRALELRPSAKALLRRARARAAGRRFEAALEDARDAEKLPEADLAEVDELREEVERLRRRDGERERLAFGGMFDKA